VLYLLPLQIAFFRFYFDFTRSVSGLVVRIGSAMPDCIAKMSPLPSKKPIRRSRMHASLWRQLIDFFLPGEGMLYEYHVQGGATGSQRDGASGSEDQANEVTILSNR
jgi:hypothetical protein